MAGFADIAEAAAKDRAEEQARREERPTKAAAPAVTKRPRGRPPKVRPEDQPVTTRAQARIGKRALVGHFSAEMHKEVNRLAFDRDITLQALIGEALDDMLKKHKRPTFGER